MAKFEILTGKKLKNAIAGRGKAVATFTEREHQLAYSALYHVEMHSCASHLNALLEVTPANYRRGLVSWATAFGKVKFDTEARAFEYAKDKKSDMEKALEVAPANYEKAKGADKAKTAFDEVAYLERVVKKLDEEGADPRVLQAVKGALTLAKTPAIVAPAKQEKAKAPKAKPEQQQPEVAAAA
ncbi:hypothetical protein EHS39_36270 [Ensifer sp. MPMI2T]|nr:hypothetical protein EHS39_36270 [Ensifer sp. MPMI2T]